MTHEFCDGCQNGGALWSGLPGVLSNGERCDACARVPNDEVAVHLLTIYRALMTAENDPADLSKDEAAKALDATYALTEAFTRSQS